MKLTFSQLGTVAKSILSPCFKKYAPQTKLFEYF